MCGRRCTYRVGACQGGVQAKVLQIEGAQVGIGEICISEICTLERCP
jgi:hypothetical protein